MELEGKRIPSPHVLIQSLKNIKDTTIKMHYMLHSIDELNNHVKQCDVQRGCFVGCKPLHLFVKLCKRGLGSPIL